jgi:uncharacterized protein (TIGR03437 family)
MFLRTIWRTLPLLTLAALSPVASKADALAYASTASGNIYKVNLTQGTAQLVGHPGKYYTALALTDNRQLYGISEFELDLIDTQNGTPKQVCPNPMTGQGRLTQEFHAMANNQGTLIGASTTHGTPSPNSPNTATFFAIEPENCNAPVVNTCSGINPVCPPSAPPSPLIPLPPQIPQLVEGMTFLNPNLALITTNVGALFEVTMTPSSNVVVPVGSLSQAVGALAKGSDGSIYALGPRNARYKFSPPPSSNPILPPTPILPSTYLTGIPVEDWGDLAPIPAPEINNGQVLNAASLQPYVAQDSLATIFGRGFAEVDTPAPLRPVSQGPLFNLGGVSVSMNGHPCPIYFAGTSQIYFKVPAGTSTPAQLTVSSPSGSTTIQVTVYESAPGIFASNGVALARTAAGQVIDSTHRATPGETVIVSATGVGGLVERNGPVPVFVPFEPLVATIGNNTFNVQPFSVFSSLDGDGVIDVEFVVPAGLSGDQLLELRPICANQMPNLCRASPSVTLPVAPY